MDGLCAGDAAIDNHGVSFEQIAKSADLGADVLLQAAGSTSALRALMQRVADVATPEEGWARILKVVAKTAVADWLEGELQVDFSADAPETTTISFYAVLGVGIRERLFAPVTLSVPIDEFQRAVVLQPEAVAPLTARQGLNRLTLAKGMRVRDRDIADFELEEQALGDGERITAPPPALAIAGENEDVPPDVYTRSTKPPPPR